MVEETADSGPARRHDEESWWWNSCRARSSGGVYGEPAKIMCIGL